VLAPIIAEKTLAAIEEALHRDQGARFRSLLGKNVALAEDAYRGVDEGFRTHLGASLIGRDCPRELWYSFRWYTRTRHTGRMVRLFNRGHLEEARFVSLLQMIGCETWQHDDNGKQFRMGGHNGHFGGSLDGVVRGIPDMPTVAALNEFKTHGDKSFKKLVDEGCRGAKFEHFVQQQMYMGAFALPVSLYLAVNKNDDDLYAELIHFDPEVHRYHFERAGRIVSAMEPPARVNPSPGWWRCKFCDHIKVCHYKGNPNRSCRSCLWSRPVEDGKWFCENKERQTSMLFPADKCSVSWDEEQDYFLSKERQLAACQLWSPIP